MFTTLTILVYHVRMLKSVYYHKTQRAQLRLMGTKLSLLSLVEDPGKLQTDGNSPWVGHECQSDSLPCKAAGFVRSHSISWLEVMYLFYWKNQKKKQHWGLFLIENMFSPPLCIFFCWSDRLTEPHPPNSLKGGHFNKPSSVLSYPVVLEIIHSKPKCLMKEAVILD